MKRQQHRRGDINRTLVSSQQHYCHAGGGGARGVERGEPTQTHPNPSSIHHHIPLPPQTITISK